MQLLNLVLLGTLVSSVVVNPLPKPRSVEWYDERPKTFSSNIELIVDEPGTLVFDQFIHMLKTIKDVKWYPEATEAPQRSFESTPLNPAEIYRRDDVELLELEVLIDSPEKPLEFGVNESYHLLVSDKIEINAPTVWGALHALKTLQQLVIFEDETFKIEGGVEIYDEPILAHRGMLIDSSRNFLSTDAIKKNIDLMSMAKMNVLHWHLADTHSWPFEVKAFPQMVNDSYSARKRYSQAEMKDIIKYAYKKGVRVVPEIDLPGHANAGWKQIDEDLVSCGDGWWGAGIAGQPPPGQLDIAYNKTYEVVEQVFDEINELFPDVYFHVGHDELNQNCYNFSRNVFEWYQDNDGDFYDLLQYWLDRALPIFTKNDTTRLIMWEDIVTAENATIPKDKIILQSWLRKASLKSLTSEGYDVIVSTVDHFYLDCGFGGYVTNDSLSAGSSCDPYKSWQNIYNYDFYGNLTDAEQEHIVGAEVALWGELTDSSNLIQKAWSRTAAFAESAWSGNKENGKLRVFDMTQRIFNYREYLLALGYIVDPLVPEYCWQNPHSCDTSIS